MTARVGDVIVIWDGTIRPPAPKMVICVSAEFGYYFRINTKPHWLGSIPLPKAPDHQFLDHDSYVECASILELDDFVIDESIREKGVVGRISTAMRRQIAEKVSGIALISADDKEILAKALRSD